MHHTLSQRLCSLAAALLLTLGLVQPAAAASLNRWVDKELVPYLAERLGEHPRLKGQSFSIVAMDGDNTQAEIDDLTAYIRENIREGLQGAPGVKLVWRPTVKPWNHPRSLADLNCASNLDVNIQVGIDARYDELDKKLKVTVRALDLKEGAWVQGFIQQWEGRLTSKWKKAMAKSEQDEHLRGLKPLPFAANQPDLLASYMAQNLSCLVRQSDGGSLKLYAPQPTGTVPRVFVTTLGIVDNYIGQFREITLTRDPLEADVLLQTEVYPIDPSAGLFQLWTSVTRQGDATDISGSQTQAYVSLSKADQADTVTLSAPAASGDGSSVASGVQWDKVDDIISNARAVTVASPGLCAANNPFSFGEKPVGSRDSLPSGGCFALQVNVVQGSMVTLFAQNSQGHVVRLAPTACGAMGEPGSRLRAGQRLYLPMVDKQPSVMTLDDQAGVERFYFIAAANEEARKLVEDRLKDIPDICSGEVSTLETVEGFADVLNRMQELTRGNVDVELVQFNHI